MNDPFSKKKTSGAARHNTLSQNFTTLLNNRKDSDVQFKVAGSYTFKGNGETIYNEPTLYAHSNILRCRSQYFATMLDKDKILKEGSNRVIYISDISQKTVQDILRYIYTGNIHAKGFEDLTNLIAAANKMDLEELSIGSQAKLIHIIKSIFSDEDDNNDENETGEAFEELIDHIPIDEAFQKYIIPALNFSSTHDALSYFSQELLKTILPHMSVIFMNPAAYTEVVNGVSSEGLLRVISSDYLALKECSVWDLVLNWACHRTNLSKTSVEMRLKSISAPEYNEDKDEKTSSNIKTEYDHSTVSIPQLSHLKIFLTPYLPAMRFGLLEAKDYARIVYMVNYFLPHRRSVQLQEFFLDPSYKEKLEVPRLTSKYLASSIIITEFTAWELLRKNIFETGVIAGCDSLNHLKFKLLFRASEHGFLAQTFHQRCDNKGPTLTLVRSEDGHLFGGVHFASWNDRNYANSKLNFLFALPDGRHRKDSIIFRTSIDRCYLDYQCPIEPKMGPIFGRKDLKIADAANTNQDSCSRLPEAYTGDGATNTALAGSHQFQVSDYEVFAISK